MNNSFKNPSSIIDIDRDPQTFGMRIKAAGHNTAIAVRKECVPAACLCIKKRLNYPTVSFSCVKNKPRVRHLLRGGAHLRRLPDNHSDPSHPLSGACITRKPIKKDNHTKHPSDTSLREPLYPKLASITDRLTQIAPRKCALAAKLH